MRQKTAKIILAAIFVLLSSKAGEAGAQELTPVQTGNTEVIAVSGTPVEEIISAAEAGALSTNQNLSSLKTDTDGQSNESSISLRQPADQSSQSNQPSQPDQPSQPAPAAFTPDSLKNFNTVSKVVNDENRLIS